MSDDTKFGTTLSKVRDGVRNAFRNQPKLIQRSLDARNKLYGATEQITANEYLIEYGFDSAEADELIARM